MATTFPRYLAIPCLVFSVTAAAQDNAASALVSLVQRHVEAQRDFDQAALKDITADNYIEVSPVGEVDRREKMLSFYGPREKRPSPQVKVDEPDVRVLGNTAVILARLSYTMDAGGPARSFAMRASYVAQQSGGTWKLVSAHYTGIRPPKN